MKCILGFDHGLVVYTGAHGAIVTIVMVLISLENYGIRCTEQIRRWKGRNHFTAVCAVSRCLGVCNYTHI